MPTETFTCGQCNISWSREVVRGRKPKICPDCRAAKVPANSSAPLRPAEENEQIYKSANDAFVRQVVLSDLSERDPSKIEYPEVEIPDNANETRASKWLRRYDKILVDGNLFSTGDTVRILNDNTRGRYKIMDFNVHDEGYMYFGLIGVSGNYSGKWRMVDPWRVAK